MRFLSLFLAFFGVLAAPPAAWAGPYGSGPFSSGPPSSSAASSAGSSPFGAAAAVEPISINAETPAKLKALLAQYPAVRVKMGVSPGNGHQDAARRMIERLRDLGFEGRVQLVYADSNAEKLELLVPGFDKTKLDLQIVNSKNLGAVEFVAESKAAPHIKAERMPLGLSAAADEFSRGGQNGAFNVDTFLQLQPRRWAFKTSRREIRFGDEKPVDLQHLWNLGSAVKSEPVGEWDSFLSKELALAPPGIREKEEGLKLLLKQNADLLPAYSIDYTGHPDKILSEVMKGVKQAAADHPQRFTKPILLPVFTEFKTETERAATIAAMKDLGIEAVNVKAADLAARLSSAKPGEILFVEVGKVPPAVFENIFKEATLPVILEGKNLTNTMVDSGKPFLNILGNIDDIKPELFKD
ncbi:MAG: hypothetical protein EOP11_20105, partial [Proteobacteria bacterium]